MDEFSYYTIRIRRSSPSDQPEPPPLTGVVERLGAGEKQSFADGAELLRLLSAWAGGLPNMRGPREGGKAW
jgi:hypothetical protein